MSNTAIVPTIVGGVLSAFMGGIGFLLRNVLNDISALAAKVDLALNRITVAEVKQEQLSTHEVRINTLGQTVAVLASEVEWMQRNKPTT